MSEPVQVYTACQFVLSKIKMRNLKKRLSFSIKELLYILDAIRIETPM